MNPQPDSARAMLTKARGDGAALRHLVGDGAIPTWICGFHAQQAVEKSLKAVLGFKGIRYPFTHDLLFLVGLLRTNGISQPPDGDELASLTPYGAANRYDDPEDAPAAFASDRVLGLVDRTLEWASGQVEG